MFDLFEFVKSNLALAYTVTGILVFLFLLYAGRRLIEHIQRHRHKRILNSTEYLPEEEVQTLKQVFYLVILTICCVDILYTIAFWTGEEFQRYFVYYDIFASLVACLSLKRDNQLEKILTIFLIPISSFIHYFISNPLILILVALHFIGLLYVIKVYYGKFIHFTESNGLGISILLLFGIVFISFIFTSIVEGRDILDSFVMVSNAFTSNGYAVLGDSVLGKVNSIFLVWGGYILSGAGTATLATALISRHFNKKFEDLNKQINQLQESIDAMNNDKKE